MDNTIVHFEIPADDPERAAKFYRELFGWDIKKWEGGEMEYWMVNTVPTDAEGKPTRPGVNGGLMRRMYPGHGPVNYIQVDSVDQYITKAEKAGAKVMMGKTPVPQMGWFAQFTDPEGNVIAVWQTDPNAAGPVGAGVEPERGKA
jgi:predicted enzyme related to lactoylglutathione lyase